MRSPLMPQTAIVIDVQEEGRNTLTLTLAFKDRDIQGKYTYKPGQFNMVGFFGIGEAPISLSSDPAERSYFQHTVKALGTLTTPLGRLRIGDFVGVRGPYGTR